MKKTNKARTTIFLFAVLFVLTFVWMAQSDYCQAKEKPIKLTYALFQPAVAALSKTNTAFAKEIESRTNGRVQIQIFQSGSLLGAPAMYQGILNGIADMGNGISSYSPGNFPFTSIAELPNDAESGWAASNAQYDFLMKYQPKEWGEVQLLTVFSPGCDIMGVGTGKAPIRKLEDWKGKSIRTNHADIIVALGGTVKDVPMTEVYDSISKGVLDGVVGSPEPLASWKLGDVCKYVTLNMAPVQPSIMWYNAMNKNSWNKLPKDIQGIIKDVSKKYVGELGLTWDAQAVAGIQYCKKLGNSVYVLPKEEQDRWIEAILPVIDARLKKLAAQGMTQAEVEDAWKYFKDRVAYWNGKQAENNIATLADRLAEATK